jgi:hypothetical protein
MGTLYAADTDPAVRDRFLDGVKETEAALERLAVRVRCEYTRRFVWASDEVLANMRKFRPDPLAPVTRTYEVAVLGDWTLESGTHGNGLEYVMGTNKGYAFRLERPAALVQYALTFLEPLPAHAEAEASVEQMEKEARLLPLCTWYMVDHTVSHYVESPLFRIKNVSAVSADGQRLVRVDFEHLVDDPARKKVESLSDAYLVCDPERNWALREYRATMWDGCVYHVTIDFGERVRGFPIPRKITRLITKENVSIREMVTTFEVISPDVLEEEFYLTHYGLPEPTFRRGWLGSWVWYLIGGIVCLVVGRLLLRRRKAAA